MEINAIAASSAGLVGAVGKLSPAFEFPCTSYIIHHISYDREITWRVAKTGAVSVDSLWTLGSTLPSGPERFSGQKARTVQRGERDLYEQNILRGRHGEREGESVPNSFLGSLDTSKALPI